MPSFVTNLYCPNLILRLIIRCVSFNNIERLLSPNTTMLPTREATIFFGSATLFPVIYSPKKTFLLCAFLLLCVVSELEKPSSPEIEPGTVLRSCVPCLCNLACLISELQKPSSLGIESRIFFLDYYFLLCNILFKTTLFLALFFYLA
jgi:hypothetical protein